MRCSLGFLALGALAVVLTAGCGVDEDQRGVTRPQGAGCDAGAFELNVGP